MAETLLQFPLDSELILEAVYTHSKVKVMDGRRFAAEFIRFKELADQGKFDKTTTASESEDAGNGWNEVVKRGGNGGSGSGDTGLQGQAAGFKVVPGRNKGRK